MPANVTSGTSIAVLYYGTAAQRRRARNRRAQAEAAQVDLEEDHKTAQLLVESPQLLMEMSFKQLLQAAQQNGWYRQGGAMRLRQGIWVIDPTVPGRVENSRFVITKPPSVTKAEDGSAVVYFSFKSRPDSSTTGQRARGYVRFLPDKRARYQFGNKCHVFCTCFAGDTKVLMEDGTYCPIRDVKVGDRVMTHLGRPRRVTNVMQREVNADESTYRMKVQGHPDSFVATGNHPFWTLRGNTVCLCGCEQPLVRPKRTAWSPELLLGRQYIQGHGSKPPVVQDRSDGWFDWVEVDDLQANEWFVSPWPQQPDNYTITSPDFARLVGYYAAEGCINSNHGTCVRLTFNRNEWDTLAADALAIGQRLGMRVRRVAPRNQDYNWCHVYINDKAFRTFCQTHVPGTSLTKQLSQTVIDWDAAAVAQLLVGMMLGDGDGRPKRTRTNYYSSSPQLAAQFQHLCSKLRLRSSLSYHSKKKALGKWHRTRRGAQYLARANSGWQVCMSQEAAAFFQPLVAPVRPMPVGPPRKRACKFVPENGQLRNMLMRKPEACSELVYDLTVEEDHSFIVHGVAVHNCQDFKYHWAFVLARAGASHVPTGLGGEATNTAPTHTNPEGHIGVCKHLAAVSLYLTARSVDYNKLLTTMASEPRTPARPNPKPKPEPKPMVPKEEPKDEDGKDLEVAEIDPDVTPITSPENEP